MNTNILIENWVNVPTNSILTIHGQTVMVNPIIDGYSDRDPYHKRSSAFAQTKGLTTNEKAAPRVASPLPTPNVDLESHKRILAPMIPPGIVRSRTPEGSSMPARNKTPLSYSESVPTPSDVRAPPSDPPPRQETRPEMSGKLPSQGNIKKKRRSLNIGEQPHPADHQVDTELPMPESPVQSTSSSSRTPDYTTSEKAARVLGMSL